MSFVKASIYEQFLFKYWSVGKYMFMKGKIIYVTLLKTVYCNYLKVVLKVVTKTNNNKTTKGFLFLSEFFYAF